MLGPKECAVLGVISIEPVHGYELMHFLETRGYEEWTEISLPSVYRIIASLEKQGLISGSLDGNTRGAPKKLYSLTAKGRSVLKESLLDHLENPTRSRSSFDLGIAHVDLLDRDAVRETIDRQLQAIEERNARMHARWEEQKPVPWNVEALFVHGNLRYRAEREYLEYLLERIDSGDEK